MNLKQSNRNGDQRERQAFTVVEVVMAMAILGMLVLAVYGAITSGVGTMRLARENLRATQVMLEKMEALRLYNWDQLNTNFMPTAFVVPYDVNSTSTNKGIHYRGRITIEPADTGASYNDEMRRVTVRLDWTTGYIVRHREMTTYVCRSGLQNYVYQ
jgi:prepilin-type N-terminal cleavage/methylation domain-containing protein